MGLQHTTYAAVADRGLLTQAALSRMLAWLSSRRYPAGLKPVGELRTHALSRSAVSRRLVVGTQAKLDQVRSRNLARYGRTGPESHGEA